MKQGKVMVKRGSLPPTSRWLSLSFLLCKRWHLFHRVTVLNEIGLCSAWHGVCCIVSTHSWELWVCGRERSSKEKSNRELRITCSRALSVGMSPDPAMSRPPELCARGPLYACPWLNLSFWIGICYLIIPLTWMWVSWETKYIFLLFESPGQQSSRHLVSSQKVSAEWINKWRKERIGLKGI